MPGLKHIARKAGIDDELATRFVEAIGSTLEDGERVTLRGLGSFTPVEKKERTFSTPLMQGGEKVRPAHVAVKFSPSSILQRRLNPTETD